MVLNNYYKLTLLLASIAGLCSFGYLVKSTHYEALDPIDQPNTSIILACESTIPELETNIDTCSNSCTPRKQTSCKIAASGGHELGFSSFNKESEKIPAVVEGEIPTWLDGSFIAIGPAVFELNESKALHWLDGFGMIHQFSFSKDTVTYNNKLIKSAYHKDCCKKGKIRGGIPEQKKSMWSKLSSALSSNSQRPIYDNANVNIAVFNKQLVALTETPHHSSIDAKTLETKAPFKFDDKLDVHFSTAHPIFDPQTQEWFGFAIQFAHNSSYIVYKMDANKQKRQIIATLPVGYPAYMHSFALTKNYIIITQPPLTVSPYDLLLSDTAFIEAFNWKPKNGTHFIIIDRHTGKQVADYKTDSFFTLHHVNAFEKNGNIVIDLIAYQDPKIIQAFEVKNLRASNPDLPGGRLKRYTLDLKGHTIKVNTLSPHNLELPHINSAYVTREHQFVYTTACKNGFAQELIKLDLSAKRHQTWECKNCYPTEPVFVAKPGAKGEDDGVVLSLVLDTQAKKSFVLILDAKTFKEIGRAYAPHHIPFTSHSKFFNL